MFERRASVPDLDHPAQIQSLVTVVNLLRSKGLVLAYHDRSDGGLWATLCEMAFAGNRGVSLTLDSLLPNLVEGDANLQLILLHALFNEELGAVLQIPNSGKETVLHALRVSFHIKPQISFARLGILTACCGDDTGGFRIQVKGTPVGAKSRTLRVTTVIP